MTDPVRAKLSDKVDHEAALSAAIMFDDDIGPCGDLARAYLALESRLAAAEGLAEEWLQQASVPAMTIHGGGYMEAQRDCADELSGILKGEGK